MPDKIQPSFAGGELSPRLYARVDLAKWHTGVALAQNFFVDYRGGLTNRSGTEFVGYTRGVSRLIPFQFSITQAYVLVFSETAMLVVKNGALVTNSTKTITGITQAATAVVTSNAHGFSNGDLIEIASVGGMTEVNGRTFIAAGVAANTFQLHDIHDVAVDSTGYTAYTSGGTASRIMAVVSPYAAADLAELKYTQSADTMTFTHPSYPPYDLTRASETSWSFDAIVFASPIAAPTGLTALTGTTAADTRSYYVTAVDENGNESLPSNPLVVAFSVNSFKWTPVATAVYYNIYVSIMPGGGTGNPSAGVSGKLPGFLGLANGAFFADNGSVVPDYAVTPPVHANPFAPGAITRVTVTNNGSGYTTAPTASVAGAPGAGAVLAVVWDAVNHVVIDVVVTNGGHDYVSPVVSFAGGGGASAAATATVGPTTGTYPVTVTYFQQRKWFGGSNNAPQDFWATKTGQYQNMDVSFPVQETDALSGTLVSNQVNNIRSMVSMPSGLIVLTGFGAWQISGGGTASPVTVSNMTAQAQAYNGASHVLPIVINYDIVYVSAKGNSVRDIAYDFYKNIYTGTDISVYASHLFVGYEITEWAYADAPFKIVWAIRDDGILLSLTILKEQEVLGWAQHNTDGDFKSVCSVSEDDEDAVYFLVKRDIDSDASLRYIERMHTRQIPNTVTEGWFLDSGLAYSGASTSVLSGLEHLEGETISVFNRTTAETYADLVVSNNQVTLPAAVTTAVAGIPFTAKMQTLYLDVGEPTQQGKYKNVTSLTFFLYQTFALKVGPTFDTGDLNAWNATVLNFEGTLGNLLYTGEYYQNIGGGWTVGGQYCAEMSDPYPVTILGVVPEFTLGD